jgi:DNA-binding response OmpR family regulator
MYPALITPSGYTIDGDGRGFGGAALNESTTFSCRVAVLDDDLRFIRMVERALADTGIGIAPVTTLDADEAVRVISSSDCLAAMIDVYMYGEAAGFDIVRRLRAQPATGSMPLILTTGARREVGRYAAFLQAHDCDVLLKPFAVGDLVHALTGAIQQGTRACAQPDAATAPATLTLSA